jgi:glyoxylase-like metal-dependent hydrolase (beta-lactamase superfamily II)
MNHPDTYEVTIVKFGTRSTHKSDVYLNFHIYDLADDPVDMDYFFWVLKNADRTIVIDTGFSKVGGENRKRTFLVEPSAAFAELGVNGADAPDVVITHAHYDHAGNLDLFPDSRVIMSAVEFEFWTSKLADRRQFKHSSEPADLDQIQRAHDEGRLVLFDDKYEVAPGVDLITVGGHTPGQAIVLVQTDEGPVLLASDSIHYMEEYEKDLPFMFVADLPGMYTAFDTIRSMMDTGVARHLVAGHDPDTLNRFTPVTTGILTGIAATIGTGKNITSKEEI